MTINYTKVNGVPTIPAIEGLPYTQGNHWHVKPYSGSDSNDGDSPNNAFKTLAKALDKATANQNDIVFMYSESNTAANTTDYQSSTLDWNKDMVHLVGVGSDTIIGQRARVGLISTYATASNLITVSADSCIIKNIAFFAGVADTNPTGCMKVTGSRNHFVNCQISGIGNANNDIANAYSLYLYGAAENTFSNCYIGLDTVSRGAQSNSEILFAAQATRNTFENCVIAGLTSHATNWCFVRAGVASLDRWTRFVNCEFLNAVGVGGATGLTQAMVVSASAGGYIVLNNCLASNATDWNSADTGNVIVHNVGGAATAGLGIAATR